MLEAEGPGGSEDQTEITWGIGAQYDVTRNLGLRLQWQRYETDDSIDFLSLGVLWKF
jgi:opacity protein-like surface antigen